MVDPHNEKAIADALLKLVADKNLWLECRKNGLRNIHRFSWPEHCQNYLSHIKHCRNHNTSRLEIQPITEEPISDSLKDVEDLSLRFSIEVDSKFNNINPETDPATRQKELIEAIIHRFTSTSNSKASFHPGRRQRLVVIAADCYDREGIISEAFDEIIKSVMKSSGPGIGSGRVGVVILTGLSLKETMEALNRCNINIEEFDALVCNSGSEMYYPWKDLMVDADYEAHVEYRWPGENIRSMVHRLVRIEGEAENVECIEEYVSGFSSRCYSYNVKPGMKVIFLCITDNGSYVLEKTFS